MKRFLFTISLTGVVAVLGFAIYYGIELAPPSSEPSCPQTNNVDTSLMDTTSYLLLN